MLRALLAIVILAALSAGCSKEPYQVAPVSGIVKLDGKPVPQVAVMFQPIAQDGNINPGPGAFGVTDEQGRYSLQIIGTGAPGGVVGKHKVRMVEHSTAKTDPYSDAPVRPTKPVTDVPQKYNQMEALFEFEVPAKGSTEANFDLLSK